MTTTYILTYYSEPLAVKKNTIITALCYLVTFVFDFFSSDDSRQFLNLNDSFLRVTHLNLNDSFLRVTHFTLARTHSISGLKSRVLKLTFLT